MRRGLLVAIVASASVVAGFPTSEAQDRKAPASFEWQTATPESQGIAGKKLEAMRESLAAKKTKALLVIRNDRVVLEWYAEGHSAKAKHYTASMAKALVGGVSTAVALDDKRVALDDRVSKHVPAWKDDPKKSQITLRQLGSHSSGLDDAHQDGVPHEKLPGWMGEFWKRLDPPDDPFMIARDRTPVVFDPGTKMRYSNPGIAMLSYAVTTALKDAPEKDVRTLLRDRVMRPLGVADAEWSVGYGKTFTVDGLPLVASWGGGGYTGRATARVGRLMLREGDWDGKRLLTRDAVRAVTSDAGTPGDCGIGWWSNNARACAALPADAYWAAGAGHQILLVVPSLKLIAVRNGDQLGPADSEPVHKLLFEPLADAITDVPKSSDPYPPSKVVTRVEWAPKESIVRKAKGSDNWPMTWADDDHLYTAYGDGNGFDPRVPEKLSLGFARVEVSPTDFKGVNLRTPTGETKGDGKDGVKASGMLMVEGELYLLARNARNSRLAWSADHGKTWEWAGWKFATSFGCPTFLNFGKDYAGARDEFVYVYSHDSDSAYTPADRMVLARAPKGRLKERDAYEFFAGLDAAGRPRWSKDVADRAAVFTHKGKCYRSGISYNAGLKRYLWCQTLPAKDPRFAGGFGIYDAPQPWGPWTTVFHTEEWDVGPGESSSLPTKWMSRDGRTLHLVFSGDDCFSVRKLTLHVAE